MGSGFKSHLSKTYQPNFNMMNDDIEENEEIHDKDNWKLKHWIFGLIGIITYIVSALALLKLTIQGKKCDDQILDNKFFFLLFLYGVLFTYPSFLFLLLLLLLLFVHFKYGFIDINITDDFANNVFTQTEFKTVDRTLALLTCLNPISFDHYCFGVIMNNATIISVFAAVHIYIMTKLSLLIKERESVINGRIDRPGETFVWPCLGAITVRLAMYILEVRIHRDYDHNYIWGSSLLIFTLIIYVSALK